MDILTANAKEIGLSISSLREKAGLKQSELAKLLDWSPAVLSRVENGDRALSLEELKIVLNGINTTEAIHFESIVKREWQVLARPPLNHADQDLLWKAELVAQELQTMRDKPEIKSAFEKRLQAYIDEINLTSAKILNRQHNISFIGSIGIGKTTAICKLTGLEVEDSNASQMLPALEAGGGGVTICEVHISQGPAYGFVIEPRSDEAIRTDIEEFAEYLLDKTPTAEVEETESQGISKEVERAIRNMASLTPIRQKGEDGKTIRIDPARNLAEQFGNQRELVVEILSRMALHRRDRRDVWFDASCGKLPMVWLQETFEAINNGRHPDFTLPKRIKVITPTPLLGATNLSLNIIDTKGIDRTAARADLEMHLYDSHTLTVLCSSFNNAPSAEPRLLLERAQDSGITTLLEQSALMILPRPNEATAVKDESGYKVETVEDGYELKGEQVCMALQPIGLKDLPTYFFNAQEDNAKNARDWLVGRIVSVRKSFCRRLEQVTDSAKALLSNYEEEQTTAVIKQASEKLMNWISANSSIQPDKSKVYESLLEQLSKVYASTIRATVRREGEWSNLSYSHHLGYGARRVAVLALEEKVRKFRELCTFMAEDNNYSEAREMITQVMRLLESKYSDLLRKIQLMGQTSFREEFKSDPQFWLRCDQEWGQGFGYRVRVLEHNKNWFMDQSRIDLEKELGQLISREWTETLQSASSLLDV